jgi:hypothetical protein
MLMLGDNRSKVNSASLSACNEICISKYVYETNAMKNRGISGARYLYIPIIAITDNTLLISRVRSNDKSKYD